METQKTAEQRTRDLVAAAEVQIIEERNRKGIQPPAAPARSGTGTDSDPIRYEHIDRADPRRRQKLAAQLDQFEQDAKAGKVLCLSDLMISAGM